MTIKENVYQADNQHCQCHGMSNHSPYKYLEFFEWLVHIFLWLLNVFLKTCFLRGRVSDNSELRMGWIATNAWTCETSDFPEISKRYCVTLSLTPSKKMLWLNKRFFSFYWTDFNDVWLILKQLMSPFTLLACTMKKFKYPFLPFSYFEIKHTYFWNNNQFLFFKYLLY